MDTNADDEKEFPSDESVMQAPGDVEFVSDIVEPSAGGASADLNPVENEVLTTIELAASKDGYWATLRGSYSWNADGTIFTWYSSDYVARDNDRDEGNVEQSLYQAPRNGTTGWYSETTKAAVQNGQWQPHRAGSSIPVFTGSVRIGFAFDYDRAGVLDVYMDKAVYVNYKPATPTIDPIKNFTASTFEVKGAGGVRGATIILDNGGGTIGGGDVQSNGHWSAQVTVANTVNSQRIQAYQQVRGINSNRTELITVYRAALTSPTPNATVPQKDLMFRGRAAPSTVMSMLNPADSWDKWADNVTTDTTSIWGALLTKNLPSGPVTARARHTYPGIPYGYTQQVTFILLGYPAFKGPGASSLQEQIFSISGDNAVKDAIVVAYVTGTGTEIGRGNANEQGAFSFDTKNLSPGPVTIDLEQFHSQKQSGRGTPRLFKIRPTLPTLASRPKGEGVELHGAGYNGAKVDIHRSGDGVNILLSTIVSGSVWAIGIPPYWLPGTHNLSARQSVSDGGTDRIFNTGWVTKSINLPTPKPKNVSATVNGQKPTFTGSGNRWDEINGRCFIFDGSTDMRDVIPGATVGTDQLWSTTAISDLPPGNYPNLTARQWVNAQWSAYGDKILLTIPISSPEFTQPAPGEITGQWPVISGSAWPGSAIILTIPGKPNVPLTATGGVFSLNATEDWAPRTYVLSATAAFGGQTSTVATRTFTVKTPVPNPTTTGEVSTDTVIEGKGWPRCWVEIFSPTHLLLGSGPVEEDKSWAIGIGKHLPGPLDFYCRQKESEFSTNVSDPTENRTVTVAVPRAQFTVPAPNGRPPRKSTFSGTTEATFGFVELSIKGSAPFITGVPVIDRKWTTPVELEVGNKTLEVRILQDGHRSDPTENDVTVVPGVPPMDTPRQDEKLGATLRVSGFGFPGDTTRIDRRGRFKHLATVPVTADGTWSALVAHGMIDGEGITAVAYSGNLTSQYSELMRYKLLTPAPKMTEPLAGEYTGVRPLYSGLAEPRAIVTVASCFNTDDVLAPPAQADVDGRWSVVGNKDLPVGPARVAVRQTVDGKDSEWAVSGRFIVESMAAGFEAPTLQFPEEGQDVGLQPRFKGGGVPGAEVTIIKAGDASTVVATARVGRDGTWETGSEIKLSKEPFTCSVSQSRDGVVSAWLLPNRTFNVTDIPADRVIVDEPVNDPTQVLERRTKYSGRGIPGALVQIWKAETGPVYAETIADAQGRWSVRCDVELPVQTYAHQINALQIIDERHSPWLSNGIYFMVADKIDAPLCGSPASGAYVSIDTVITGTAAPGVEVRLYRAGFTTYPWGRGTTDQTGRWEVVLSGLPVGGFQVTGKGYKGPLESPWMGTLDLNVIDAG